MLTESFVASSSSPPKVTSANSSLLKDAGIFLHSFQPQPGLRGTFKKSATAPNCVVFNDSHIFAAQSGKAVVHVYNREKGNHEATVPFPEQIHSLALAAEGTLLLLGTKNGALLIWEICTGRQLSTPQSHLRQVTCLEVDLSGNFALSGSADSSIHVWSLLDLTSFIGNDAAAQDLRQPRHRLSNHRSAITALALGHSTSSANIAVSASEDKTAIVWNYQTGEPLRTYILGQSPPRCLTLDPADRAFYIGYDDGSVQIAEFFTSQLLSSVSSLGDSTLVTTPVQLPDSTRWTSPSQGLGDTLSLSLTYDGTMLLSGHESGKIIPWDVASGQPGAPVADYAGAPITSIQFLRPTGFSNERSSSQNTTTIIKPRPHEAYSSAQGQITEDYAFNTQVRPTASAIPATPGSFQALLDQDGFSESILSESIAELASWNDTSTAKSTHGHDHDADFMALDSASHQEKELLQLREQVTHLKKLQNISVNQIMKLTDELAAKEAKEKKKYQLQIKKLKKINEKAERQWKKLHTKGKNSGGDAMIVTGDDPAEDEASADEASADEGSEIEASEVEASENVSSEDELSEDDIGSSETSELESYSDITDDLEFEL